MNHQIPDDKTPIIFRPRFAYHMLPKPQPGKISSDTSDRMIERWIKVCGIEPKETALAADYEEWYESATILFTALDTGLTVFAMNPNLKRPVWSADPCTIQHSNTILRAYNRDGTVSETYLPGSVPPDDLQYIILGSVDATDPLSQFDYDILWPRPAHNIPGNNYFHMETFKLHAGREFRIATLEDETPPSKNPAVLAILDLSTKIDQKTAVIKIINHIKAAPIQTIEFENSTPNDVMTAIYDKFGYSLVQGFGGPAEFLIQGRLDLSNEYRVIVIGGKPICAAGCIEDATPMDNRDLFDRMLETKRNSGIIVHDHNLASRFAAFANIVAEKFATLDRIQDYVLDLALSKDPQEPGRPAIEDEIVIIELNPVTRFGLYAMNVRAYVDACIQNGLLHRQQSWHEKRRRNPSEKTDEIKPSIIEGITAN